jgi:hypothetical protein
MTKIRCKNNKPYVERSLCDEFTWHVYNTVTGDIVASTYDEDMARTILIGIRIRNNPMSYQCGYAITETWKEPEPMV